MSFQGRRCVMLLKKYAKTSHTHNFHQKISTNAFFTRNFLTTLNHKVSPLTCTKTRDILSFHKVKKKPYCFTDDWRKLPKRSELAETIFPNAKVYEIPFRLLVHSTREFNMNRAIL